MKRIFTSFFSAIFLLPLAVNSQIVINEYSAANVSTVADNNSEYRDWVELYNAGASAVTLTGYYMSDDDGNIMKWAFPSGSIAAGGFLKVICSGNDVVAS